jgi:hypothetical protein
MSRWVESSHKVISATLVHHEHAGTSEKVGVYRIAELMLGVLLGQAFAHGATYQPLQCIRPTLVPARCH